ncbi:hypothetical protein C8R45DRAFT_933102 [Mycena sanguinolenta]|nr:hypothetical protein C8R45DRAFT_933102 [Mycena sanguinolenta]
MTMSDGRTNAGGGRWAVVSMQEQWVGEAQRQRQRAGQGGDGQHGRVASEGVSSAAVCRRGERRTALEATSRAAVGDEQYGRAVASGGGCANEQCGGGCVNKQQRRNEQRGGSANEKRGGGEGEKGAEWWQEGRWRESRALAQSAVQGVGQNQAPLAERAQCREQDGSSGVKQARHTLRRERGGGRRRDDVQPVTWPDRYQALARFDGNGAQWWPQSHQNIKSDGFEPPITAAEVPSVGLEALGWKEPQVRCQANKVETLAREGRSERVTDGEIWDEIRISPDMHEQVVFATKQELLERKGETFWPFVDKKTRQKRVTSRPGGQAKGRSERANWSRMSDSQWGSEPKWKSGSTWDTQPTN